MAGDDDQAGLQRILLYVTGFGPFQGVTDNPSQQLVEALPMYLKRSPCIWSANIELNCRVIETSAEGSKLSLQEIYKDLSDRQTDFDVSVILHFGVHAGYQFFRCEAVGYNEANFLCPDERGAVLTEQCVVEEDQFRAARYSPVPTLNVVQKLAAQGHKVECTSDPGRFVCNHLYYNSLCLADALDGKAWCLFVHIPDHAAIPEKEQLSFARSLIDTVISNVKERRETIAAKLSELVSMGFEEVLARRALVASDCKVEVAIGVLTGDIMHAPLGGGVEASQAQVLLTEMGFDSAQVAEALEATKGDFDAALDKLSSSTQ